MSQPLHTVLALLLRRFGQRIEGGGYEVGISDSDLMSLSPFGQIQEQRDVPGLKTILRYYPNNTVEGIMEPPSEPPLISEVRENND